MTAGHHLTAREGRVVGIDHDTAPIPHPGAPMSADRTPPPYMHAGLAATVAELLARVHAAGILAPVLALVGGITSTRAADRRQERRYVDVSVLRRLVTVLHSAGALAVLPELLDAVEPHLVAPIPTEPTIAQVIAGVEHSHDPLSDREREVLVGMSQGKQNGQIGRSLYLSEDTVKTHARRLFRKMGANDRAHAVYLATCCGCLPGRPATSGELSPRAAS